MDIVLESLLNYLLDTPEEQMRKDWQKVAEEVGQHTFIPSNDLGKDCMESYAKVAE